MEGQYSRPSIINAPDGVPSADREVTHRYSRVLLIDDDTYILESTINGLRDVHGCNAESVSCSGPDDLQSVTENIAGQPPHTLFVDQYTSFHDQGNLTKSIIAAAVQSNHRVNVYEFGANRHPYKLSEQTKRVLPHFESAKDDGTPSVSILTLGHPVGTGNARPLDTDILSQIAAADLLNLRISDAFQFAQELSKHPSMASWDKIAAFWPDMLPDLPMNVDMFNTLEENLRSDIAHAIFMIRAYMEIGKGDGNECGMQMSKIQLLLQPLL